MSIPVPEPATVILLGVGLLVLSLLALNTIAYGTLNALLAKGGDSYRRDFYSLIAGPLYVALYLSLAVVVGRLSPLRRGGAPTATRVSFLGLVAAAGVLFPVAAMVVARRSNDRELNLFNPIIGMVNFVDRLTEREAQGQLALLAAATALCVVAALVVLKRRDRERTR